MLVCVGGATVYLKDYVGGDRILYLVCRVRSAKNGSECRDPRCVHPTSKECWRPHPLDAYVPRSTFRKTRQSVDAMPP